MSPLRPPPFLRVKLNNFSGLSRLSQSCKRECEGFNFRIDFHLWAVDRWRFPPNKDAQGSVRFWAILTASTAMERPLFAAPLILFAVMLMSIGAEKVRSFFLLDMRRSHTRFTGENIPCYSTVSVKSKSLTASVNPFVIIPLKLQLSNAYMY